MPEQSDVPNPNHSENQRPNDWRKKLNQARQKWETELSNQKPADNLRVRWNPDSEILDAGQVETLLSRDDFREQVIEAIRRTEVPPEGSLPYQEHGFVGYRLTEGDTYSDFYLSPLFAGDEHGINLQKFSEDWAIPSGLDVSPIVFRLHTHSSQRKEVLLLQEIFRETPKSLKNESIIYDTFSVGDLRNHARLAKLYDFSLVSALGVINSEIREVRKTGRLIMISYREYRAFKELDTDTVVKLTKECKSKVGSDYLDVYRNAGLNVAVVNIDLTGKEPFNPAEVKNAARELTRRVY